MKDDAVSTNRESTSQSLLQQAQAGLPQAWERLLVLYQPLVTYWCLQFRLREGWSEDIVQDVFLRISQNLGNFRHNGQKGAFRKWLRTITQHMALDGLNAHKRNGLGIGGSDAQQQFLDLADRHGDDTDPPAAEETTILYHRAWELIRVEFSVRDVEIFRRIIENGEQPKNVAEDMGVSPNTVSIAVCRMKKRLRDQFADAIDS
jgi:RNA polymerase sigma-70 factor (ECF subfamily)